MEAGRCPRPTDVFQSPVNWVQGSPGGCEAVGSSAARFGCLDLRLCVLLTYPRMRSDVSEWSMWGLPDARQNRVSCCFARRWMYWKDALDWIGQALVTFPGQDTSGKGAITESGLVTWPACLPGLCVVSCVTLPVCFRVRRWVPGMAWPALSCAPGATVRIISCLARPCRGAPRIIFGALSLVRSPTL